MLNGGEKGCPVGEVVCVYMCVLCVCVSVLACVYRGFPTRMVISTKYYA